MSTIYNVEPPTKGKVIIKTSAGELDMELWPKEAPLAVRNFVQLCMEGYYDGCIFHRLMKDYLVQTGDPSGTGTGGISAYGKPFKDEFHSRLKFSHRGLVACANANEPHTNASQFFITLDRAEGLDKKNTIFGKVTGDTIYNLANMNDLEVDDKERPLHPPVIESVEILWNPFEDIEPRSTRPEREAAAERKRIAKEAAGLAAAPVKKKAKMNAKLLSFGEDPEDAADLEPPEQHRRIRSAHDVIDDERLVKENTEAAATLAVAEAAETERMRAAVKARLARRPAKAEAAPREAEDDGSGEMTDATFDERMRAKMLAKRDAMRDKGSGAAPDGKVRGKKATAQDLDEDSDDDSGGGGAGVAKEKDTTDKRRRKALEGSSKAAAVKPSRQVDVIDAELLKPWERKRQEYKQRKKVSEHREKDTMQRLAAFTSSLRSKPEAAGSAAPAADVSGDQAAAAPSDIEEAYAGKVRSGIDHRALKPAAWRVDDYLNVGEDEATELDDLRGHTLVFAKTGLDTMDRNMDLDNLVVHDPLLEDGKAKWNKQEAKLKKSQTAWRGDGAKT